jgi:hypothetical protein
VYRLSLRLTGISDKFVLKYTKMIKLVLTKDRKIWDVQQAFNTAYPYLKLDFHSSNNLNSSLPKRHLLTTSSLESAGLKKTGELELREDMSVYELEQSLKKLFGLNIHVSRKAGMIWLETTKTDKWSLEKQNEHGREISIPEKEEITDRDITDLQ